MEPNQINKEMLHRKSILLYKKLRPLFTILKGKPDTFPVFILGYGRSGTTMLTEEFQRDKRIEAYGETHPVFMKDFRLIPSAFTDYIRQSNFPILVVKPILESYNPLQLLSLHENAKVIWLIRNYNDVIASALKKFSTKVVEQIKDAVNGCGNNWIANGIQEETKSLIQQMNVYRFSENDWMGLVWWSVNRTIQIHNLTEMPKQFLIVSYENLVKNPDKTLQSIYSFLGFDEAKPASKYIHSSSVGKGKDIELTDDVLKLCEDLWSFCVTHSV